MLLSVIVALSLSTAPEHGYQVDWKASVVGKYSKVDEKGRKCEANLNHVYRGSIKLYGGAIGILPGSTDETKNMSQADLMKVMQTTKVYRANRKSESPIHYTIDDTFKWTRVDDVCQGAIEGYEGFLKGSGSSAPVDHAAFAINSANNDCRLMIQFQNLKDGPKLTNAYEEYVILDGKKEIGVKGEPRQLTASINGQGLYPPTKTGFLGFIRSKGFISMSQKVPAIFKMYQGDGGEVPVEVSIEAAVKRIPGVR